MNTRLSLAMYQPDIPQNVGAMLRLCACLGVEAHLIEPFGFPFDDRRIKRSGMDYLDHVALVRHTTWKCFLAQRALKGGRLILLTTKASQPYTDFSFLPDDRLIVGRESAGSPPEVHEAADARIRIPLRAETRSFNVAMAAAMALGEALRQTGGFPRLS